MTFGIYSAKQANRERALNVRGYAMAPSEID